MASIKIRTMEEFAARCGISRPTVSKYFFDPKSVRPSTRERIETALERYDYRPNLHAINQNRRAKKTIAIMVPQLVDPFFAEIVRYIERMCIEAGFRPLLFSAHGDPALEAQNLDTIRGLRPAGAMIAALGEGTDLVAVQRTSEEVPTVLFDSELAGADVPFIGSNNTQSFALVVDYLCRTGEPPVFFQMKSPPNPNALKRRTAYSDAMVAQGYQPHVVEVEGEGWDFEAIGFRGGLEAIANRSFVTNTVLCSNDRLAIGLLAAAYEKGLRVGVGPGCAMRVAGHDDHPYAAFTCPPLTTVSQDYSKIASHSFDNLVARIDGANGFNGRTTVLFDGTLVLRQSA